MRRLHPGEYLKDNLISIGISRLVNRAGIKDADLLAIISGSKDIDEEMSHKLSEYFGCSEDYWLNLQRQYNEYKRK